MERGGSADPAGASRERPTVPEADLAAARADPRRRFGPFLILSELGRGGMGAVFRAWDERLRRLVAVKTLLAQAEPEAARRFRTEAEAVARLRHPGIVGVHEVGEVQGRPFLVMDLIEGATLEASLRDRPGRSSSGRSSAPPGR